MSDSKFVRYAILSVFAVPIVVGVLAFFVVEAVMFGWIWAQRKVDQWGDS